MSHTYNTHVNTKSTQRLSHTQMEAERRARKLQSRCWSRPRELLRSRLVSLIHDHRADGGDPTRHVWLQQLWGSAVCRVVVITLNEDMHTQLKEQFGVFITLWPTGGRRNEYWAFREERGMLRFFVSETTENTLPDRNIFQTLHPSDTTFKNWLLPGGASWVVSFCRLNFKYYKWC